MQLEAVILKDVLPYLQAKRTFLRRAAYGACAALVVIVGGAGVAVAGAKAQSDMGGTLFNAILWVMLAGGAVECMFLGATAISSERQRNTVDVWILAGMEHFWMVAAKVACVLTRAAAVVMAPVVPAAVALYLGGRTITDAAVGFLAVASIMILVAALSVSVSSLCRRNSDSVPAAITIVIAVAVVPGVALNAWAATKGWGAHVAASLIQYHPFTLLIGIGQERGTEAVSAALWGFVISAGIAIVLMLVAGAHLRGEGALAIGNVQPVRALDRLLERVAPSFFHLFKPRPGSPDDDPILWRERVALRRGRTVYGGMTVTDKLAVALALVCCTCYMLANGSFVIHPNLPTVPWQSIVVGYIFAAVTALVFIYTVSFIVRASQAFSREFESGQMDLVRMTRLTGEEIVAGKVRAYVRHYSPVVMVAVVWGVAVLAMSVAMKSSFEVIREPYTGVALGIPWAAAAGWALAAFGTTAMALLSSLYFMIGMRAMFAAMLLYFGPSVLLALVLAQASAGAGLGQLIVRTFIGAFILSRLAYWSRAHVGFKSRHECLLLTAMAGVGAAASGPILGPFVIYLVAKTLMQKNFSEFLLHGADRYRMILRRPALSYERSGAYVFTHLGVPPHIERRLMRPDIPNAVSEKWKY